MASWMKRTLVLCIALVAVAGFAAGCGDDDDDEGTTTESGATESETTAAEPATIVEAAQATPDLSTLVEAVTAAGLAEHLSGPAPTPRSHRRMPRSRRCPRARSTTC